tara:strand:+ start:318 stop:440 length:123 start_codon:yes stop_codon:yes gene_type:complete
MGALEALKAKELDQLTVLGLKLPDQLEVGQLERWLREQES